jgi:TATA-box binding protein (TBP) (component of TFIID and TFIIIB)
MLNLTMLKMPTEAPAMDPLKLDTMTICANINQYFNLDVLARYVPLNETIVGIRYRDIHRGIDEDTHTQETLDQDVEPTKSGRFKNQCTFVINDGTKIINTKLFNNGKIVNVGCIDPEQARFTALTLLKAFQGLSGFVKYTISKTLLKDKNVKSLKKFFKDELRKKYQPLIMLLKDRLALTTNLDCLNPSLTADDGFIRFSEECNTNEVFVGDIMYIYTIINILKLYYNELLLVDKFSDALFQNILSIIVDNTNRDLGLIAYEFPGYIMESEPVFDPTSIHVTLINKRTKCNYFINRALLQTVLEQQPNVVQCDFDKNRFPGVIAQYQTPFNKVIKIFIFNTGKINITAACTNEQIEAGYVFISSVCKDHFQELLLKCEYQNKQKEYDDSFPDQHYVGLINDQSYYLLYKTRILSNPRNVRFLHQLNLLDKYR